MRRTRVKLCGITRQGDAQMAVSLGVDALGFVFVAASARHVELRVARRIAASVSPFVMRVGLFLDAPRDTVAATLDAMPELVPQFHGRESPAFCESFGRSYLKAIGVADGLPARASLDEYEGASGFLLDSHAPGELGGTGHAFDWNALGDDLGKPLILAGGLDATNVARAIGDVGPYALDISSGVESAKGIKDAARMQAFMSAVRAADENTENTGVTT